MRLQKDIPLSQTVGAQCFAYLGVQTSLVDAGRRGAQWSEVKEEAVRPGDTNGTECHIGLRPAMTEPRSDLSLK